MLHRLSVTECKYEEPKSGSGAAPPGKGDFSVDWLFQRPDNTLPVSATYNLLANIRFNIATEKHAMRHDDGTLATAGVLGDVGDGARHVLRPG